MEARKQQKEQTIQLKRQEEEARLTNTKRRTPFLIQLQAEGGAGRREQMVSVWW